MHSWITFLVTGPEDKLMTFQWMAMSVVELFDRRKQTVRCRAHGEDGGRSAYDEALALAKKHDVTMQDLVDTGLRINHQAVAMGQSRAVVSECVEEYPIVHLGTHGMKW